MYINDDDYGDYDDGGCGDGGGVAFMISIQHGSYVSMIHSRYRPNLMINAFCSHTLGTPETTANYVTEIYNY